MTPRAIRFPETHFGRYVAFSLLLVVSDRVCSCIEA